MTTEHTKYYAATGNFNPEDFTFEDWFDQEEPPFITVFDYIDGFPVNGRILLDENGEPVPSHRKRVLDWFKREGYGKFEGRCQHCGQPIRYCCVFRNVPNDELIIVGTVCAEQRMTLTLDQFKIKQEQSRLQAEATKAWKAEQYSLWIAEDPARADLIEYLTQHDSNSFYYSLLGYFKEKGRLSERQEEALRSSIRREQEKVAQREQEKVERNIPPAPDGKGITICGIIRSIKWQESDFGDTLKMLVEAPEGWKVWGSVPSSLQSDSKWVEGEGYVDIPGAEVNDEVEFVANLTRTQKDETFAYFSRPRKATITKRQGISQHLNRGNR